MPQQGVEGFEKIFGTPHDRDLAKIAAGFGISKEVVTSAKELHIALQRSHPTIHVIIAKMPSREANAEHLMSAIKCYKESVVLSKALRMGRSFAWLSAYSRSGSDPATMPQPA